MQSGCTDRERNVPENTDIFEKTSILYGGLLFDFKTGQLSQENACQTRRIPYIIVQTVILRTLRKEPDLHNKRRIFK